VKRSRPKPIQAFTRIDLLLVVILLALLAVLLLPVLAQAKAKARRAQCLSNLKEIALGYRVWAYAHSDRFPWSVSQTNGGTLEAADWADHDRACSNEFQSPKVLVCPSDREKCIAAHWSVLDGGRNVSFFVGLDAEESKPQSIVAGDRNVNGGGRSLDLSWSQNMGVSIDATWLNSVHVNQGEIALADGSARQAKTPALREQIGAALQSGSSSVTFSLPRGTVMSQPQR
jgi:type II secretory pathway pseudopilin PulG